MITKNEFMELVEAIRNTFDEEYGMSTDLQTTKEMLFYAIKSTNIDCDITLEDIAQKF